MYGNRIDSGWITGVRCQSLPPRDARGGCENANVPEPVPTGSGLADPEWQPIAEALIRHGIPALLRSELRTKLSGRYDGLLLYGSWARGDANEGSDLDILVLNFSGLAAGGHGQVNIAKYSVAQLKDLSGTLFGFHLARDGLVLFDPDGILGPAVAGIEPPPSGSVVARVRSLSQVLDVAAEDRAKYLEGLTKVARYLLRSALYALALDEGEPCFSVREIAERRHDPALASILSSHADVRPEASKEVFDDLCRRLAELVGPLARNPYGDLHGLIEGAWTVNRDLSNFATLALADDADELPYDELPKVTL